MPNSIVNAAHAFPGVALDALFSATGQSRSAQLDAAREAFGKWLAERAQLRVFADADPGAALSSVRLLRRLVAATDASVPGYAYAGTVELVYEGAAAGKQTLARLLPELGGQDQGKLGGATVKLIAWADRGSLAELDFGLTGGAATPLDYAAELKTKTFLRLQPFAASDPEQVQFTGDRTPVELGEQALVGRHFSQRAYALELPAADAPAGASADAKIVEWLSADAQLAKFDLVAVHGIRAPGACPLGDPAGSRVVMLVAGLLDSLRQNGQPVAGAKPIVVVNADHYAPTRREDRWSSITEVLAGQLSPQEAVLTANGSKQDTNTYRAYLRRKAYFEGEKFAERSSFLPAKSSLAAVQAAAAKLQAGELLWVQLDGELEQPDYDRLFTASTLPPVLSDAGTANLAVVAGAPFLLGAPPQVAANLYPSRSLGRGGTEPAARQAQAAANQIRASLLDWPQERADAPPARLGAFLRELRAEADTGPIRSYFKDLRSYYATPSHDKLNVALAFVNYLLQPGQDGVLEQVWAKIQANLKDKQLDLIPGVVEAGAIVDFFAKLLETFGATLSLQVESHARTPATGAIQSITLSGISDNFGINLPVGVDVEFTAPEGVLVASVTFTGDAKWSLAGLPWIVFRQPFMRVDVANADVGLSGAVGGRLAGNDDEADSGFDFAIPVPFTGVWTLSAAFPEDPPSIDRFFQILGGNNPSAMLPAPLNVAANLGLSSFELAWDNQAKRLLGVALTLETRDSLALFGDVSLTSLSVDIELPDPADPSSMEAAIAGAFGIGKQDPQPQIAVSVEVPKLRVIGSLEDGPLEIAELFAAFLPGIPAAALPDVGEIDEASFSWVEASQELGFSLGLSGKWTLDLPLIPAVELTALSVELAREGQRTSGQISGELTVLPEAPTPVALSVAAGYADGWSFSATQTGDGVSITAMLDYYFGWSFGSGEDWIVKDLAFSATQDGSSWLWDFSGAVQDWSIPFLGLTLDGTFALGTAKDDAGAVKKHGEVSVELEWEKITLTAYAKFAEQGYSFGFALGPLTGTVAQNAQKQWVGTLALTDQTLGGVIETFVSWVRGQRFGLPKPWDILDDIPLGALELEFNFSTKKVRFNIDIGPIEMGFARIDKIAMSYEGGKALVTLDGSFRWQQNPDQPLGWDAADPSAAPTPPGQGSKYLDLRLLALGQRVSIKGSEDFDRVEKAITAMRKLPKTEGSDVPVPTDPQPGQPYYDPKASWLIGADFGVLRGADGKYFITLQIVFNDPRFYALRVALDGPAAKVLAGLDFQILYRQISDSVGVYQAELTLPAAMRTLTVGAYTITMPVFAIAIYTNGDFFVDIGFPWNQDFSRSFTVEAIIPPGIPVIGSAGFYFGKLSGETATTLPVYDHDKGQFNPVIRFGFGVQVGFGKSIQLGLLSAGFSLTVFGILEGTIARWNPFALGESKDGSLDKSYYFKLTGTFGIIGRLWGTIDFAIIKANVDITIKVFAQITFESNMPIPISVCVSVDVKVSVKIDLGLFSIRIHFSFSARIKQTFVLGKRTQAPWDLAGAAARGGNFLGGRVQPAAAEAAAPTGFLGGPATARMSVFRTLGDTGSGLNWTHLEAPAATTKLEAYFAPALTVVGDEAASAADQLSAYVACLYIDSVAGADRDGGESARKAAGELADTSFEILAKQLLRWAVAAVKPSAMSAAEVDAAVVTEAELDKLRDALAEVGDSSPVPLAEIDAFMSEQFRVDVSVVSESGEADATLFPMPPQLVLDVPAYADQAALRYRFAEYNSIDAGYVGDLREYFAQLALSFAEDQGNSGLLGATETIDSIAEFLFADYFVLLLRQLVQAARDSLRDFKWPIDASVSLTDTLKQINDLGQLDGDFDASDLFTGNGDHALTAGKILWIVGARRVVGAGESFDAIAGDARYAKAFSARALALANASVENLLRSGASFKFDGQAHSVPAGASLDALAKQLGVETGALLDKSDLLGKRDLLVSLRVLALPDFKYTTASGDTLLKVAGAFDLEVADLATKLEGAQTGLFSASADADLDLAHLPQFQVGAILAEIQRSLGLQHLSGMASRFYLHGLRLPTAGITPKVEGLLVSKNEKGELVLPPDAGLFALTGQAFAVPEIGDEALSFSLIRDGADPGWLVLPQAEAKQGEDPPPPTLTVSIAPGSPDAKRIAALRAYISTTSPDLSTKTLGPAPLAALRPASYPLTAPRPWYSAEAVSVPGGGQADGGSLRLWPLPPSLRDLPPAGGAAEGPLPRVGVELARYDEASGTMQSVAPGPWTWATTVDFSIKKVTAAADSPTSADSYEIVGATTEDIVVLERLLAIVRDDDSAFAGMWLAYGPDSTQSSAKGLQSDAGSAVKMSIAQTNLSTQTRPPAKATPMFLGAVRAAAPPTLFNQPSTFVRLLWEASITRSGGFYLYYRDTDEDRGLPDHIFTTKAQASLSLVILWTRASGDLGEVQPYYNALLTGKSFATRDTVLRVVAKPQAGSHAVAAGDTLASVAARSFSDLQELGEQNQGLALAAKVSVRVPDGVHQVPPASSQSLADIAAIYAGSDEDRKASLEAEIPKLNPGLDFSAALPELTALRLPALEVVVGTHPGGDTLASIADFYGTSVGMLATANGERGGLFATDTSLKLPGGPWVRASTAAPGTAAWEATREVPAAVPSSADDPNWAERFVEHDFALLGLSIAPNQDFVASNLGLPAGPCTADNDPGDKIRVPQGSAAGELWDFGRALAYTPALKRPEHAATIAANLAGSADLLPSAEDNPYLGNDRLLQIEFEWLDYYGNQLRTPLTDPAPGAAKPWNQPPTITGYTDKLLGPGQWPSSSLSWQAAAGPLLRVEIDFSSEDYAGDGGAEAARRDLEIYRRAHMQLSDPNGIRLELIASLLGGKTLEVAAATREALVSWVASVHAWLVARAKDQSPTAPPAFKLDVGFTLAELSDALIHPLTLELVIAREGVAARALASVPAVARSLTKVAPLGSDQGAGTGLQVFASSFESVLQTEDWQLKVATGTDREAAASQAGGRIWAVRVGKRADQALALSAEDAGKPAVFAPRPLSNHLQRKADVPIYDYVSGEAMNFDAPSRTVDFADIDADLWARRFFDDFDAVLSPRYTAAMQIVGEAQGRDYLGDLLAYKKTIAGQVKTWMIPAFADPEGQTDASRAQELFHQGLLEQLGNAYRVRAAVEFGATVAGVETPAGQDPAMLFGDLIHKPGQDSDTEVSLSSPKLELTSTAEGQTRPLTFLVAAPDRRVNGGAGVQAKASLALDFAGSAIEHEVAAIPGIDGYKASSWLRFVVDPDAAAGQLAADLGNFDVPLILRAYPEIPSMSAQSGTATTPDQNAGDISELTRWTYGFDYGESFHYPQDVVHAKVRFNIQGGATTNDTTGGGTGPAAEAIAIFNELAEWVSVFPAIEADLRRKLAPVEPGSSAGDLQAAAKVLDALLALLAYMFDPKDGSSASLALGEGREPDPYLFEIHEGSVELPDPDPKAAEGATVEALLITIVGEPPKDGQGRPVVQDPRVELPGYSAKRQKDLPGYAYTYEADGKILDAEAGQAIRERQVELPGIDILGRQDAWASVYVVRNRDLVPGRPTADEFVYTTSPVQFANPLRPTLERTSAVDIAKIPDAGESGDGPFKRSLAKHLEALFATLLRDNLEPDLTMQLAVQYAVSVNPALPETLLPMFMLPPTSVAVLEGGSSAHSLAEVEAQICAAVERWFANRRNLLGGGELRLDLTVFSSLTKLPQPLLRLRTLSLAVDDIVPALPTRG